MTETQVTIGTPMVTDIKLEVEGSEDIHTIGHQVCCGYFICF